MIPVFRVPGIAQIPRTMLWRHVGLFFKEISSGDWPLGSIANMARNQVSTILVGLDCFTACAETNLDCWFFYCAEFFFNVTVLIFAWHNKIIRLLGLPYVELAIKPGIRTGDVHMDKRRPYTPPWLIKLTC